MIWFICLYHGITSFMHNLLLYSPVPVVKWYLLHSTKLMQAQCWWLSKDCCYTLQPLWGVGRPQHARGDPLLSASSHAHPQDLHNLPTWGKQIFVLFCFVVGSFEKSCGWCFSFRKVSISMCNPLLWLFCRHLSSMRRWCPVGTRIPATSRCLLTRHTVMPHPMPPWPYSGRQ